MIDEKLEFAISQYLDGVLSEAERAALEERLSSDAEARRVLGEYRALNDAIKSAMPLPSVQWDRLAESIGSSVSQQRAVPVVGAAEEARGDEQLELLIMRHVDGELDAQESAALEKTLAASSAARQLMAQHRALDAMLKHSWPVPHVDYARLRQHISEAVAEEAEASVYRIANWLQYAPRVALAACVLIVLSLAAYLTTRPVTVAPVARKVIDVRVDPLPAAQGAVVIGVGVSESEEIARTGMNPYISEVVVRPKRMEVAAAPIPIADYSLFTP